MQHGTPWLRDCFDCKGLARFMDNKLDIRGKLDQKERSPKQMDAKETEGIGKALLVQHFKPTGNLQSSGRQES